jgi:GNAT superfamily N-acetyltransferase
LAELKLFGDFNEFAKYNESFIDSNPFLYFNLKRTIDRVYSREVALIKFFNVLDGEHFACGLLIENECLLYANSVSKDMTPLIYEGLDFKKFKRYHFFGTRNIIEGLFNEYKVKYSEQKHRKYYECVKATIPFKYAEGQATMSELNKFSELVQFSDKFNDEFYGEEKPIVNTESIIRTGLAKGNIYQWVVSDQLVSMAQVMYDEQEYPVLGHVFTLPNFRGKGYSTSLIHTVTKGLVEYGHEKCLLMTNAYNPASNRSFQKAGYELVGEYVVRYKEE